MTPESNSLRTTANEDGAAILDASSGTITTLNSTGAFVWQALQHGADTTSIAKDLAQRTGEELLTVQRDIDAFVKQLAEQRLWPC